MSLNSLETTVWRECQRLLENSKMRKKDLLEWSTGDIEPREGEILIHIPSLSINVVVLASLDKRKKEQLSEMPMERKEVNEEMQLPEGFTLEDLQDHIRMEERAGTPITMNFGKVLSEEDAEQLFRAYHQVKAEMGLLHDEDSPGQ